MAKKKVGQKCVTQSTIKLKIYRRGCKRASTEVENGPRRHPKEVSCISNCGTRPAEAEASEEFDRAERGVPRAGLAQRSLDEVTG